MIRTVYHAVWILFAATCPIGMAADKLPAFPGAEGFGACTPGGRGGMAMFVTTLEDYLLGKEPPIPGSLRAAVVAEGARYVLFRVGKGRRSSPSPATTHAMTMGCSNRCLTMCARP